MSGVNKISVGVVERLAPSRGPSSSEDYNATNEEILNSLAQIGKVINEEIQPLLDTLPGGRTLVDPGKRTASPNPYRNGFDGSQIYTDMVATEFSDDGRFFDSLKKRPLVLKETFNKIQAQVTSSIQELEVKIAKLGENAGITPRQKQAIGSRIFEPGTESSIGSLDGLILSLSRNIDQIGLDISGNQKFLTDSGTQTLSFSILEQLAAIQKSHNYDKHFNSLSRSHLQFHGHRYNIIPVGALDGENRDYRLNGTERFIPDTLRVVLNGVELQKTKHFTEHPDCRGFRIEPYLDPFENDGKESDDCVWIHYDVETSGER